MHHQFYDVEEEEEFEPRVIPKPTTKFDCFAVPSVPEVSLIFEKPTQTQNPNDEDINSTAAKSTKPMQFLDNPAKYIDSISPNSNNQNSYAAWRKQNYSEENNHINTTHVSPSYVNPHNHKHALHSKLQDISIQTQVEQNQICDMQNRLTNTRPSNEIHEKSVKFRCTNADNSLDHEQETQTLASKKKKQLSSCNSVQRAACNVANSNMRVPNNVIMDALTHNEHLQGPYATCPYPFQQFYTPGYPSRDVDNNETVKTLLQLVNNQSEQIKTLQSQVDRLVRLQEESFRNKTTCMCSSSRANQMFEYPVLNCYDATNIHTQSHNQVVKENPSLPVTEIKDVESLECENKESKKLETLLEQQPKKTFMEQKVSIGVMTSFEFTVQNNPLLMDSEMYKGKEVLSGETNSINKRNPVNLHDTSESVQNRYKSTFTRKPGGAQLENIVEDTESYLSSSQQQSSHFNTSSSVRDSERHTSKQSDSYNTTNTSETPKVYEHLTDRNREKTHDKIYARANDDMQEQINTRKISTSPGNMGYSAKNANSNKAFIDTYDYTTINRESNNDRMSPNAHPFHNVHLPATNYYQSQKNKDNIGVKEVKSIGDSMMLSAGDFKVFERPPTPEPSIHVEMQEYMSDDESDNLKRTSKIGWTFYNNVLEQVNEILHNSSVMDEKNPQDVKATRRVEQEDDAETRAPALNTVKATTLEQLRKLGISLSDNEHREPNGNNKTMDFDSSYYPRLDCQANMMHTTTSVVNETNTSVHMKALALKYLSDEQLADIALHKQGTSSLKHLMLSNMQGTNLSFATMRYLERYQLLPGRNNVQVEDNGQIYGDVIPPKRDLKTATGRNNPALRQIPFAQTPGTTCPSRILDISTLKRQPKLL